MKNNINDILSLLNASKPNDSSVRYLESDVWQRIAQRKIDEPSDLFENFLAMLFPANHRLVPVMCAALIGMTIGMSAITTQKQTYVAKDSLNLQVFYPQDKMLSLLTNTEGRI